MDKESAAVAEDAVFLTTDFLLQLIREGASDRAAMARRFLDHSLMYLETGAPNRKPPVSRGRSDRQARRS